MAATENFARTKICIVGAGPAGVAASISLSKEGIRHLLLDAAHFPRHKPCGDIITSGVLRVLNRLDADILQQLHLQEELNPIWHSLIYPPGGKAISLGFKPFDGNAGQPSCYSISRFALDEALIEKVRSSDIADFREGCRIKSLEIRQDGVLLHTESNKPILAELVILATGSGSSLPAKAGLPVSDDDCAIGIRAHYENTGWPSDQTALFLKPDMMPGGLYITPLSHGRCNVNLVFSLRKAKKDKVRLRDLMEEQIASLPELKEAFSGARISGNPEGSRLFLGIRRRQVSSNRILIAGDAAGLIEFFSGNGIPQAYGSGMLAAEVAAAAIRNGNFSASFLKQFDRRIWQKYQKGGLATRLFFPILHQTRVSRLLLRFLSFLASRPRTNSLLRDLLYSPQPVALLRQPAFWYKLLLASVHQEYTALSHRPVPEEAAESIQV